MSHRKGELEALHEELASSRQADVTESVDRLKELARINRKRCLTPEEVCELLGDLRKERKENAQLLLYAERGYQRAEKAEAQLSQVEERESSLRAKWAVEEVRAEKAEAQLSQVERERDNLRIAIENYSLWEPGRGEGHAEAHRRLLAALHQGDTDA